MRVAERSSDAVATICFDLGSFEGLMSTGEVSALARQLVQVYGYNRGLAMPFYLSLAGLSSAPAVVDALASHSAENWVLQRYDASAFTAFPAERELIYLSADADEVLSGASVLNRACVLIIGGLVDYEEGHEGGSRVGAALRVARDRNVRACRLPLDGVVRIRKASLTCLAVVQIIAGYVRARCWRTAIREAPALSVAPLKKYVTWIKGAGTNELATRSGSTDVSE